MASSVSGITLNTSNGSIAVNSFAQAYTSIGSAFCTVSFSVNKSLVANNDSSSTVQGPAKVIPVATLTANEVSQVYQMLWRICKSVTPNVMSGDNASFEYVS